MSISPGKSRRKFEEEKRHNRLFAQPGPMPFRIVLDGLKATYNIGKIFRSAQGFGAAGIDLIGISNFNPYPALGAFRYVPASFRADFAETYKALREAGYTIYALMPPEAGSEPEELGSRPLAEKAAFVLGHEEHGVSFQLSDYPDVRRLTIPMLGSVQSLNVSVAASIVMFEYVRRHRLGELSR